MEAVLTPYAMEQSISPNRKQMIRTKFPHHKNGRGNSISNPSGNFDKYAGLLNPPPIRAMSLSNPLSASLIFNHQHRQQNQQQQPPLLPLPNVPSLHQQQPLLSRTLTSGQGLSRNNRPKEMSLTPKKSKPTKREEVKKRAPKFLIVASDTRLGPDPKDLPKHLPVVLTTSSSSTSTVLTAKGIIGTVDDMFSSSVLDLSPPPSSLPLPKFFLRSKLSCNTEVAGVDAGATNNLRRLLRLR